MRTGGIWSFRPLAIFWAVILIAMAAGAGALQLLGPTRAAQAMKVTAATAVPPSPPAPESRPAAGQAPQQTAPGKSVLPPAPLAALTATPIPAPLPDLLEPATELPGQMLARIAADGRTPARIYAAPFDAAERHPRIALVLDGVGLDQTLSARAMQSLPAAIDVAFSAYAPPETAGRLAEAARSRGRECLVSLPMEPSGYPLSDEGNLAMLTGADAQQNRHNMQAALGHVQGCIGATGASDGMAGERFSSMHAAFGDLLLEISNRGLLYLDARPGTAPPDELPPGAKPPLLADIVIDRAQDAASPATAETIDSRLAALEKLAAEHGSAIGVAGPPRPVLVERLAIWANGLAARGLVLAPLSSVRTQAAP